MASTISHSFTGTSSGPAWDTLRSSISGAPLRVAAKPRLGSNNKNKRNVGVLVVAKGRKIKRRFEQSWPTDPKWVPDPNVKGGLFSYLSTFKPLKEKPKPVSLAFEKPLLGIEKQIKEVRRVANETGLDFSVQIGVLELKYQKKLEALYKNIAPIDRVHIARHPNRPTFLDHVFNITETFVEYHGDRAGYDDPAIVTGIGSINDVTYMFIGHQKGRNTKENIQRNFGMPTPHGYRKALRMMYHAEKYGFPIITFVDTPGAYADLKCEELNQGEAIARNLKVMFGLKVPIVTVVIGEGGSGGALAIGCANKMLMLENAVYFVASPEACAAILWKDSKAAPQAAARLKITAPELCKIKIADGIIPEPLGGAHTNPAWTSQQIKAAILREMDELKKMDTKTLLKDRYMKFRKIGVFREGEKKYYYPWMNGMIVRKNDGPVAGKSQKDEVKTVQQKKKDEPVAGKNQKGEVQMVKQKIFDAKK